MPLVSRASLGAEFMDITSRRLLMTPEPQYFYAQLWKMALNAAFQRQSGSLGWRGPDIGTGGDPYPEADKDRLVLEDPNFKDVIIAVPELGNKPGHTVRFNRPLYVNSTYTQASREVANGKVISTTPINIGSEQVSITCKRWAGPYDSSQNAPAPYGVDRFDANMAIHSVSEMVGSQLQRDLDRTVDTFIGAYLDLATAANTLYAGGYTADTGFYGGAATGGINASGYGEAPFSLNLLNQMERTLSVNNVPTFPDGKYVVVVPPLAIQELKDDPQFLKSSEYHPPVNVVLAASYYRTIGRTHIFQSNTLPTTTNGNSGQTVYHAQGFGPGVLGSGISEMPRVAKSSADNYGEWALVIWLMYGGFQLFDNRLLVSAHFN